MIEFGAVQVIHGEFEGRVGYYDDDTFEEDKNWAIVYFKGPFDDYELIDQDHLENVDVKLFEIEKFKRNEPALAKKLGLK